MKTTKQIAGLSILTLALAAGSAFAQSAPAGDQAVAAAASSPKTRAQVKQELFDAERNGETRVGFVAMTRGELDPTRYPAAEQARYARAHSDQNRATQSAVTE